MHGKKSSADQSDHSCGDNLHMNKDSSEHVTRSNSAKRTSSKRRVTFDLNSSCDSSSFSPSDPSEKCATVHNSRPKPVALATSVSKENNQRLQQKAEKLTKTSERMDSSATACFDSTLTQPYQKPELVTDFPKITIPEPEQSYDEILRTCVRKGTRNLTGYVKGRIKTLTDIFGKDSNLVADSISEFHNACGCDSDDGVETNDVYKVWKAKADTSKLVTRDDGYMYQKISQHVFRGTLMTPRDTVNMMDPTSYTGVRITEGVYESGEKFKDVTKWFPRETNVHIKSAERKQMKERWKGDSYFQLVPEYLQDDQDAEPTVCPLSESKTDVSPADREQLDRLTTKLGWTTWNGSKACVAQNAKHFLSPEPHLPTQLYPYRSTFVSVVDTRDPIKSTWYQLEDEEDYLAHDDPYRKLSCPVR